MAIHPTSIALTGPLLCLSLLGCPGAGDDHADDGQAEHHAETHADTHGDTHDQSDCAMEDRDDEYMVGLSKSGDSMTVTFVSADPAPPALDDNTWVISVTDPGGAPLDVSVTVTPFMPDHGHGTPVETVVAAGNAPGEYHLSPVNLFMQGLWEVTLDLDSGDATDSVVFAFCVE